MPNAAPNTPSWISAVEANERQRLAEVLHDSVGQVLSLCRIKLDSLSQKLSDTPQASELATIRNLLDQTIDETHTLVGGTSPLMLRESGLAAALRKLAEVYRQTYGLNVRVIAPRERARFPAELRETLFTAVRELLTNARKYSGAERVTVTMRQDKSHWIVQVKDDGRGFDPEQGAGRPSGKGGFGLRHIAWRCEQAGAEFAMVSAPNRGTTATVRIPLRNGIASAERLNGGAAAPDTPQ